MVRESTTQEGETKTKTKHYKKKIRAMKEDSMLTLLNESFPYLHVGPLRPVVVELLTRIERLPPDILRSLSHDKASSSLPLEVRRKLWEYDVNLFREEILPVIAAVIEDQAGVFSSYVKSFSTMDSIETGSFRARSPPLQRLVELMGKSQVIYMYIYDIKQQLQQLKYSNNSK